MLFKTRLVWIISVLIALGAGWALGRHSMRVAATQDLRSIQAILAYNRIDEERRLARLIARGCISQAAEEIDFSSDKDQELLAHYLQEGVTAHAEKYISDRDPQLLGQLRSFKSKYGNVRAEKACSGAEERQVPSPSAGN
jgi:hypothetical protein